jgi:multisubunit Na+/H+ antiporter MnhB subunit
VLVYALVTVLFLLALAPQRYLRPIHVRLNDYRAYAAAVAIGLSAALFAAQLLP